MQMSRKYLYFTSSNKTKTFTTMAYITAAEVKVKREALKAAFPASKGWKFSVRKSDSSCLSVTILAGPEDFSELLGERKYRQYHRTMENDTLKAMFAIINEGNFDKSDSMTDYFHVGFYVHFYIGTYENGYTFVSAKAAEAPKAEELEVVIRENANADMVNFSDEDAKFLRSVQKVANPAESLILKTYLHFKEQGIQPSINDVLDARLEMEALFKKTGWVQGLDAIRSVDLVLKDLTAGK